MSVFGTYSRYYNLLYKDKDYAGEAAYVRSLIEQQRPGAKTVLDLGCGTGRHDLLLAGMGYEMTGVDLSEEMLAVARTQPLPRDAVSGARLPEFFAGDARSVRLGGTFDVVVSLFHVMSYQVTNRDLEAAFATARTHLKTDGAFIFDCWYGPAVLSDRPAVRIKRLEDDQIRVTRLAEPVMHPNENVVDVNYHIFVQDIERGELSELRETHRMRYLFQPEIELFLEKAGFRLEGAYDFLTRQSPGFNSWGAVFLAKAL